MTAEIPQPGSHYEIDPRGPELGGGWRLRLIEDGLEVGGDVFPASETEEAKIVAYAEATDEATAWLTSRQAVASR